MVKIKPLSQIEANYKASASKAASGYSAAISTIQWRGAAEAGQALYEERMRDPAVLSRRQRGIQKVSDAEFQAALREKGAGIIGSRMSASSPKYASGYAPYRAAIEAVSLPARTGDPIANVDNRVKPIVQAMVDTKNAQG